MAKQSVQQVEQKGESYALQVIGQIKAEHGDALNGRIDRAAGVWYAGGVSYLGGNEWLVNSRSRPGQRHSVTFSLAWHCTCEDHTRRAPEVEFLGGVQKTCQHIIAAGLSWLIDSPDATTRPSPAPVLAIPAWLVKPAVSHDAADMGISPRASDTAAPAWFGDNLDIEEWLG